MKWQTFLYQGQTFDISHLDAFDHTFIQPAETGKNERQYKVWVRFSHHCFTEDTKPTDDPLLLYPFALQARSFNTTRWMLSSYLPDIIKTLMNRSISHTNHRNFLTIEIVDAQQKRYEYEIYFEISRATGDKRLHVNILSAYPRDPDRLVDRPKSRKVRLAVILFNIQNNKPIHPAQ